MIRAGGSPELHQLHLGARHVGQRLLFKRRQKVPLGLSQHPFERARTDDRAGVGPHVKALDQIEVRLAAAHHLGQVDLLGRTRKLESAVATTRRFDEAILHKKPSDLAQVVGRDAIRPADVQNRWQSLTSLRRMMGQIEKNPQRVISELS